VIRLERELLDEHIDELNESFGDLVDHGRIHKVWPLPEESNEPELAHLPRIAFAYNHRSAARLIQMIRRINEMGQEVGGPKKTRARRRPRISEKPNRNRSR
jgi:hypothetical protein